MADTYPGRFVFHKFCAVRCVMVTPRLLRIQIESWTHKLSIITFRRVPKSFEISGGLLEDHCLLIYQSDDDDDDDDNDNDDNDKYINTMGQGPCGRWSAEHILKKHFHQRKGLYLDWSFAEICSWGVKKQWFSPWLDTKQAALHCLKQWLPSLATHICVTQPGGVNGINEEATLKFVRDSRDRSDIFKYLYDNALRWMQRDLADDKSTLGSVNGFVPWGNTPSPELMLTYVAMCLNMLTHWDRVTHICGGNLTIIGSDNVLSPDRREAIIWTNADELSIGPPRNKIQWNFNRN